MKKTLLIVMSLLFVTFSYSQTSVSGYVESYYAYSTNSQADMPISYTSNFSNSEAFSVNLAQVKVSREATNFRGSLILQAGDFTRFSPESPLNSAIGQAYAGVRLVDNLWLDAGVLPSHIGSESLNAFDNNTLTRSMSAEAGIYSQTGASLSFEQGSWRIAGYLTNGWGNITENNTNKAIGTQLQYVTENLTANWSTLYGEPYNVDGNETMRFLNDLYFNVNFNDEFSGSLLIDIATQGADTAYFASTTSLRYSEGTTAYTLKVDYFADRNQIVFNTPNTEGFAASGISVGFDYLPYDFAMLRLESKFLTSPYEMFPGSENFSNDFVFTASLAIKL